MTYCKNCEYWDLEKKDFMDGIWGGACKCPKFVYNDDISKPKDDDTLQYWDYEGYLAAFTTGPLFGCVHWKKKGVEK